jgi:diguanylate cyclase (GGDEF)-like protein/PAS domain S-box-containing protein
MATVVVLDDRVTNRNILTRLAMSVEEGLQVAAFRTPREALEALAGGLPVDLIITDYNMPEMDGAGFIRTVRRLPALVEVPIIVVTIYEDRDYRYNALEAGATDFLLSPVDHLEFRARARNLLTLRRQQLLLAERAADLERTLLTRTESDALAASQPLDGLMEALPVALSAVDRDGRFLLVNRAHTRLFGAEPADALGRTLAEVCGEDYATRQLVLNEKVLETGDVLISTRPEMWPAVGGARPLVVTKGPLRDASGRVAGVVTVTLDVGDLSPSEGGLEMRPAGGRVLPPLTIFRDRLEREIARARRHEELLALLHIDIDRFKGINDAFGEAFGDRLLEAVAGRFAERLRETDSVTHLHSDEFVVLQSGIKRAEDAAELARRLGDAFGGPFLVGGREVHLSASIGLTLFPGDGKMAATLLKNAELAMYRAKAAGRDCYRFFAREMNLAARRAVTLERELRQALAGDQFVVHYQPQISLGSGRLVGIEALVRWRHPHRGLVRPGEFIRLAEEIGLIAPLTAWVLRKACLQHRRWRERGLVQGQLSVNLSPVQFRERGVELMIERVLKETGLEPEALDIELTEHAVIENSQAAAASLRHLHQLGVSLSIDDFGTGYASLAYVKRLPVQRLKIDQSFVQHLEQGANDEVIVAAIINLGHSLGLKVIAEGIETKGQLERLERLGCDEGQGDLLGPPYDAVDFEERVLGAKPSAAAGH